MIAKMLSMVVLGLLCSLTLRAADSKNSSFSLPQPCLQSGSQSVAKPPVFFQVSDSAKLAWLTQQRADSGLFERSVQPTSFATSSLELVNTSDWRYFEDMCLMNGYLYVAAPWGILVFDVRSPQPFRLAGKYYYPDPYAFSGYYPREIKGANGYLYLLTPSDGIQVFDATNPTVLQPRSYLHLPVLLNFLEVKDSFLYVPSAYDYLFVIDAANPDQLTIRTASRYENWDIGRTNGIAVYFDSSYNAATIYLSLWFTDAQLLCIDVHQPERPVIAGYLWGPAQGELPFSGELQRSNTSLVTLKNNYLKSVDITMPNAPMSACSVKVVDEPGVYANVYAVEGSRLYVAAGTTLLSYDITYPCAPVLVAQWGDTVGPPIYDNSGMLASGDTVFNFGVDEYFRDVVETVDWSATGGPQPTRLYSAKTAEWILPVPSAPTLAVGSFAYGQSSRLYDCAQPTGPQLGTDIGPDKYGDAQTAFAVEGNRLYLLAKDGSAMARQSGLSCVDISDPFHATYLWSHSSGWDSYLNFRDLAVANKIAYVVAADSGLRVYDLSSPYGPVLKAKLTLPPQAQSIAVRGNRAYVVCWGMMNPDYTYNGAYLTVVDISSPFAPRLVDYQEPWGNYNVELYGSILAMTSWQVNHWLINLYQLDSTGWPVLVGQWDPPDRFGDLVVREVTSRYLYAWDGGRLDLVDISDPAHPSLVNRYTPVGELYDVAVKGEIVYVGTQSGMAIFRGPSCCEGTVGNIDNMGVVDLTDLSWLISYLLGSGGLVCQGEADINGSGVVDLSDLSFLITFLTSTGNQLPGCN